MAEDSSNLMKSNNPRIQEASRSLEEKHRDAHVDTPQSKY